MIAYILQLPLKKYIQNVLQLCSLAACRVQKLNLGLQRQNCAADWLQLERTLHTVALLARDTGRCMGGSRLYRLKESDSQGT